MRFAKDKGIFADAAIQDWLIMRDEENVYLERLGQDYASSLMEDGDADEKLDKRRQKAHRGHPPVFEGPRNPIIPAITGFDRQTQNGPFKTQRFYLILFWKRQLGKPMIWSTT